MTVPSDDVDASVRTWIAAWGAEVAAVELQQAKERFDQRVVAFGTYADVVPGIDQLHDAQRANVWLNIADFAFSADDAEVLASPDGLLAVGIVPWDSKGTGDDGRSHPRPGRATIVLARDPPPPLGSSARIAGALLTTLGLGVRQRPCTSRGQARSTQTRRWSELAIGSMATRRERSSPRGGQKTPASMTVNPSDGRT